VLFARDAVERLVVERFAVERVVLERFAAERPLLRDDPELFFALPVLAFAVLAFDLELDRVAVEAFCVIAVPTLPKSASACLLVFAASRRSAASAAVTSL
jgi:hypothetical protein